jgi:hypothetical protein
MGDSLSECFRKTGVKWGPQELSADKQISRRVNAILSQLVMSTPEFFQ